MNIAEKIKKILDKAASTEYEGEAAALMDKAVRMMEEHQLEMWQVDSAGDPMGTTKTAFYGSGPTSYKPKLRAQLACYYGARVVREQAINIDAKFKRGYVQGFNDILVGPESARITTELMTDFVWDQINKEAGRLAKESGMNRGAIVRRLTNAMLLRIHKLTAANKDHPQAARTAAANALVVKLEGMVEEYMQQMFPNLRAGRAGGRIKIGGAAIKQAAEGISLNRQATGKSALALK